MMKNGYFVHFKVNECKIFDSSNKEIAKVQMRSKSFFVKWTYAYKAESNEMNWL